MSDEQATKTLKGIDDLHFIAGTMPTGTGSSPTTSARRFVDMKDMPDPGAVHPGRPWVGSGLTEADCST
jgi:hypothetical protein